jgi:hypothetical protein
LFELLFVANHDSEMAHICALDFINFENGQELVLAKFEEGVAFAAVHLFEIENVFVKRDRLFNVVHFDGDMIASIHFNALLTRTVHFVIYTACERGENVRSTWMSSVICPFCCQSSLVSP